MKHRFFALLTLLALSFAPRAEDQEKPAEEKPESKPAPVQEVAVMKTTAGEMVIEFWPEVAPNTVANFKKLAGDGFFDGTAFHRIIRGFMIQGGNPETRRPPGKPASTIRAEFNDRPHVRGVISMARLPNDIHSASSQFFLVLDRAPHLDRAYTGFGRLIKGEEVLLRIGETPVGPDSRGERSQPKERIEIESVKIVPADSVK